MRKTIVVKNKTGLHARPASEFSKMAFQMACAVHIEKNGKIANAKSILGIMSLGICQGDEIHIITEGEEEEASLERLIAYVDQLEE